MEARQTDYVERRAEVIQPNSTQPIMHETQGFAMAPGGEGYPRGPVITEQRHEVIADSHGMGGQPKKAGLGAKLKNMFGGKKNKKGAYGHTHAHGGQVIEETVHTTKTTTTTTVDQGAYMQGGHHMHGPLVANPYAQPAHGQIFVPANSAVQANPETGALLPASHLNGPVILPTGPKVIPIATNYPASQAGPMVIPPSGGFINNSGNPYLTQQTYGPSGIVDTHVHEAGYVDTTTNKKLEKEELRHQKTLEKEQKRLEKEEIKREKALEKDQIRLEKQIEKDQARIDKQLAKDEAKLAKDQEKLEKVLEKDETRLANNQMKLQNKIGPTEAKLENKVAVDEMRVQQNLAQQQQVQQVPLHSHVHGTDIGGHGVKHVFAEETKQDAFTGQVIDHNVYHKDTRF